ncbi:F0F1 ATP synthase subunit A [Bifidobacterium sp. SMB2]|uniref:ATP synthase subunit a n=1 Tax=Bifidobacterium saimiriisciurei TaxID=2661627 RepID=A0ABX0C895_9BIFI|nr:MULTISPECIES: F0F1 ATP synthase subunit A [Bifidobacterium]NEG95292.1 F0F1 ATP synthase subunit A [Bifidobacterium sp. SMB2]NEH11369.1 F0F1 ATP synthase subunit A [Bifidobacterium saimiriisciurei]
MAGVAAFTGAASAVLAAQSGPEIPSIDEFLPPEIIFAGTPFAMNRIIMVRVIMTVVMLLILGITASRAKLIPGRWQGFVEWGLDYVRDKIVYEVMGELRGKRYVPMITTIFFTIFLFNLCGIIPGMNIAATATIMMPLIFAAWTFVQYWIAACREQGLLSYLKQECTPPGVPFPVLILLVPMQLIDILIIRPASLTLRLLANMIAGHLIVALCFSATQFFLILTENKVMMAAGVVTFAFGFIMTLFEAFVAYLQAFIFATLSSVYINMSYPEVD